MTYGSESECATQYTTAPDSYVLFTCSVMQVFLAPNNSIHALLIHIKHVDFSAEIILQTLEQRGDSEAAAPSFNLNISMPVEIFQWDSAYSYTLKTG